MTECEEVAETMRGRFDGCVTMDDVRRVVRRLMPDESEQVIDNVTEAAYRSL